MSGKPQQDILLESGTNELEILVFRLGNQRYGVNVAKVREVVETQNITALPESHPAILGAFQLRNTVTMLVDLQCCLGMTTMKDLSTGRIIIMEFNDARVGFFVRDVEQIYRVNWQSVQSVPDMDGVNQSPITSIAFINEEMVSMLDFERLIFEVSGVDLFEENGKKIEHSIAREDQRILFAEDSPLMRKLIRSNLVKAGYNNITVCNDGELAWRKMEQDLKDNGRITYDILITDIEMPRTDGLHLTRRIKENAQMATMPVVIFSSLVSMDNLKKCQAVGADAQITKPQLDQLVVLIDRLIEESQAGKTQPGQTQPAPTQCAVV